jgi:hypothetical protein
VIPRQAARERALNVAAHHLVAELRVAEADAARARLERAAARRLDAERATAAVILEGNLILAGLPREDPRVVQGRRDVLEDALSARVVARREARVEGLRARMGVAS